MKIYTIIASVCDKEQYDKEQLWVVGTYVKKENAKEDLKEIINDYVKSGYLENCHYTVTFGSCFEFHGINNNKMGSYKIQEGFLKDWKDGE